MENALAIANYFIEKSIENKVSITPLKLMKLVYISHGWFLGLVEKPLIGDSIQAWKYGPVIGSLYRELRHYGDNPVKSQIVNPLTGVPYEIKDKNVILTLEKIWELYGNISALKLSNMTHLPGSPWDIVWNINDGKYEHGVIISNDIIKDYYKAKLNMVNA